MPSNQGVLLPAIGSITLQSGGCCRQQPHIPVLHLSNSLGGRFESKEKLRQKGMCMLSCPNANGCTLVAGPNLTHISYEQVAHRSRLHPSICKRIVQEALLQLSYHIGAPSHLEVLTSMHLEQLRLRLPIASIKYCFMCQTHLSKSVRWIWQVDLPGIGSLRSEGQGEARLELDEHLLQRLVMKSPWVSLVESACMFSD